MKRYVSGKNVGEKCKIFRELFLRISLKDLVAAYGTNIIYGSAAASENGKSTSYKYFPMYVSACNGDRELEHLFLATVFYRDSSIALTLEADSGENGRNWYDTDE